jgi:hypothetical protein
MSHATSLQKHLQGLGSPHCVAFDLNPGACIGAQGVRGPSWCIPVHLLAPCLGTCSFAKLGGRGCCRWIL